MRIVQANRLTLPAMLILLGARAGLFAQDTRILIASKDNTLYESATGTLSNGIGDYFFTGNTGSNQIRRGLIAFDIDDSIPAGAMITSAQLSLHMSRTSSGGETVELHKVLADWGEGTSNAAGEEGSGTAAQENDATWLHRFFNSSLWANAGGDFSATVSASQMVGAEGAYVWGSTEQMVADVQEWLDNPVSNFGWIVVGDEGGSQTSKRFDSKDNPAAGNRPTLSISFTTPTSVRDEKSDLPSHFGLAQNYPNPFNPQTTIPFQVPHSVLVRIQVFNTLGQSVVTLLNEVKSAGSHRVSWNGRGDDGRRLASGIYFYQLRAGKVLLNRRMLLLQ